MGPAGRHKGGGGLWRRSAMQAVDSRWPPAVPPPAGTCHAKGAGLDSRQTSTARAAIRTETRKLRLIEEGPIKLI